MAHEAGKGSKPRPFSVTQEEYANRWDAIFGRDLDKQETAEQEKINETNEDNKNVVSN